MISPKQTIALQSLGGDSVAVLIDPAQVGDVVRVKSGEAVTDLTCKEDIPIYHKISLCHIKSGEQIIRNGVIIGVATTAIEVGALVHIHNIRSLRARITR